MRSRHTRIARVILVVGLLMVACGGGDATGTTDPNDSTGSGARLSSTATLSIVEPKVDQVVHGSSVDLKVKLEDAKLVPATSTDIVPDEGHLHVLLDDRLISMTEGVEQTIPDVAPGHHRIQVEFVASDHAPFDPRVVTVVQFEVRP